MLRICDFNTFYSPQGGGVRAYLERKLDFFSRRNDATYSLIVPGEHNTLTPTGRARFYTVAARTVPGAKSYRFILTPGELRRVLKAEMPHVIEVGAPYWSPWLARLAARGLGARLVGFWHAEYPTAYVEPFLSRAGQPVARAGGALAWWYARRTYGAFDATFAASQYAVSNLRQHGVEPVYNTPLGVDSTLFTPARRRPRSNGEPGPGIVFAARLSAEKAIPAVLEAFPHVTARRPDARLTIAGDGPLRAEVEALAARDNRVRCLGYVDSRETLADLYANADCVVTPGGHETFSLTTLEALSCGTPAICADQGAAVEQIRATRAGASYEFGNAADLARAILEVLSWSDEAREKASQRARAVVLERYDWSKAFEHQLDCYHRVVGRIPLWA